MKKIYFVFVTVFLLSSTALLSQENEAVELNESHLFLAHWKSRALVPNDEEIEKYIYISDRQKYENTRKNEFAWKRAVNETKTQTEEFIKALDFNTLFVAKDVVKLAGYDFNKNGFVITIEQAILRRFLTLNYNYEDIYIVFDNYKNITFFPIEENEAENFLGKDNGFMGQNRQ
jgi:hypothetical protein